MTKHFSKLEILGLRGFSTRQTLHFAVPNGQPGSGLTILVGPNNSGKTTIFEALRALSQYTAPSFTEGRRNKSAGGRIEIEIFDLEGNSLSLRTITSGGSESMYVSNGLKNEQIKFYTLPSKRNFDTFFSKNPWTRDTFIRNTRLPAQRGRPSNEFTYRLFEIEDKRELYEKDLEKVLGYKPNWYIEMSDSGQHYLKFNFRNEFHSSDGLGEGLISLFMIIDAFYDSSPGELIFIDEPEVSLHPSLQRRLLNLMLEYSRNRQVVISTHSPFFVSWEAIGNSGSISRVVKESDGSKIYHLSKKSVSEIKRLLKNLNNPHILGLDANEVFFLDDNVILVEGQEDVIFYKRILNQLEIDINGNFYGWGTGGAENIEKIAQMLADLGFKKVAVILDGNKKDDSMRLKTKFREYSFHCIPTDDVRDKKATAAKPAVVGLIDSGGKRLKEEYRQEVIKLFNDVDSYLG